MEVGAHDTRDASMKHLADFLPLRGGEVSVHMLQRARVESFDLGKKRHKYTPLSMVFSISSNNEGVGKFWAWRAIIHNKRKIVIHR